MQFERALAVTEIPRGQMRTCVLSGREIVVCHTKEGIFALDNICTHAFARMSEGRLRGLRITCPLHGASFDIKDGHVLSGPATVPLPGHPVRVVDGFIEVAIDHCTPGSVQPFLEQ